MYQKGSTCLFDSFAAVSEAVLWANYAMPEIESNLSDLSGLPNMLEHVARPRWRARHRAIYVKLPGSQFSDLYLMNAID